MADNSVTMDETRPCRKHSLLSSISSQYDFQLCSNCAEEAEFDDWIGESCPDDRAIQETAEMADLVYRPAAGAGLPRGEGAGACGWAVND